MDGVGIVYHFELVAEAYRAIKRGETPRWGEPCVADALYVEDKKHLASPRLAQDLSWWKNHLAGVPDRRIFRALPGFADVLGQSRHKKYFLSAEVTQKIRVLLEARKISPATFFTALHVLIVSFMCNEKKVVVQTPVSFGERKTYSQRQGSQISLPPVTIDLSRYQLFTDLAAEVAAQTKRFFRHIRTPYQMAMREMGSRKFAHLGDIVTAAVKEAIPDGTVKKAEVVKAVIVRTSAKIRREDRSYLRFDRKTQRGYGASPRSYSLG